MLPLAPVAPPELSAAAVSRIGLVPSSLKPGFSGLGPAGRGVAAAAVGRAVLTGAFVATGAAGVASAAVGAAVGASVLKVGACSVRATRTSAHAQSAHNGQAKHKKKLCSTEIAVHERIFGKKFKRQRRLTAVGAAVGARVAS
jgi:hypothetical protein